MTSNEFTRGNKQQSLNGNNLDWHKFVIYHTLQNVHVYFVQFFVLFDPLVCTTILYCCLKSCCLNVFDTNRLSFEESTKTTATNPVESKVELDGRQIVRACKLLRQFLWQIVRASQTLQFFNLFLDGNIMQMPLSCHQNTT